MQCCLHIFQKTDISLWIDLFHRLKRKRELSSDGDLFETNVTKVFSIISCIELLSWNLLFIYFLSVKTQLKLYSNCIHERKETKPWDLKLELISINKPLRIQKVSKLICDIRFKYVFTMWNKLWKQFPCTKGSFYLTLWN